MGRVCEALPSRLGGAGGEGLRRALAEGCFDSRVLVGDGMN